MSLDSTSLIVTNLVSLTMDKFQRKESSASVSFPDQTPHWYPTITSLRHHRRRTGPLWPPPVPTLTTLLNSTVEATPYKKVIPPYRMNSQHGTNCLILSQDRNFFILMMPEWNICTMLVDFHQDRRSCSNLLK